VDRSCNINPSKVFKEERTDHDMYMEFSRRSNTHAIVPSANATAPGKHVPICNVEVTTEADT